MNNLKDKQTFWNKQFRTSVNEHIRLVRVACDILNELENMPTKITQYEISHHDKSKLSSKEFTQYARQIFGDQGDKEGWEIALMHHYKNNPHHWQYWLYGFDKLYTESTCRTRPMPPEQVMVMVADWLAASRQYQGTWVFTKWLNDNLNQDQPKIILHKETKQILDDILTKIGYVVTTRNDLIHIDSFFTNKLEEINKHNNKLE